VLIADDELLARRRLARLLSAMPEVEVVAECSSGDEALARLEEVAVDVAVLDIEMPGLTGLDVSGLLAEGGPLVIFATAHPEHAVDAFDLGVADYVLKPIDAARLSRALERARQRLPDPAPTGRLALPVRGEVRLISPESITHALLEGQLVSVFLDGEQILTDLSLAELQRRLPPDRFERVHRRALLNLSRVVRLVPQPSGGYLARTDTGAEVPISRQAARELRQRLGIG
jgi:two-component system LytT family response regulator